MIDPKKNKNVKMYYIECNREYVLENV